MVARSARPPWSECAIQVLLAVEMPPILAARKVGQMDMPTSRIAVITGASAGVGRATAMAFARHGFDVALIARGDAGLKAVADDVEAAGQRSLVLVADVADPEA
jgi:hypothetical protein